MGAGTYAAAACWLEMWSRELLAYSLMAVILGGLILAWRHASREQRAYRRARRRWLDRKRTNTASHRASQKRPARSQEAEQEQDQDRPERGHQQRSKAAQAVREEEKQSACSNDVKR